MPNRFNRDRTAAILQKDMWAVAYLRPFRVQKIAKTGDSDKRQLLVDYTLEGRNELANGKCADLLTA